MECGSRIASPEAIKPLKEGLQLRENKRKPRAAERRQLTILFCDLVGSTPLSERLDPEDYRQVILGYQQVAEKVIKRYGGHIAQYLGDGLLVYFGYPEGLEDAPKAGVRAGLSILETVSHANQQWEAAGKTTIQVRIGIHTGLVVVDDHLALGDTVNIAARLEGLAPFNGLVISPQTLKLVQGWFEVKSTGEHNLKGISKPMEVFQVLHESGARTRLEAARGKGLSPLAGRDREQQLLQERWARAKTSKGNLVLLNGEAGIGKSRMVDTLKEEIAQEPDSWLTEIRCSAYHQNSTFYPIIELLESVILQYELKESSHSKLIKLESFLLQSGLDPETAMPLFAEFLSISSQQYPPPALSSMAKKQRIMENITQGLVHRAAVQPVLLVIEDLHWADASTLEWLNMFLGQLPTQPIFILCTSRPGFRPDWIGRTHVSQLTLQRLSHEKVADICRHYAKGKDLPQEILEQINAKTEGVPLFVEELTKMVLESGLLVESESSYELAGVLPPLAIPSTLQDSLLARLDRLSAVKEVVQLGAVLGRKFSFELLSAIIERKEENLKNALSQLVEAELLYRIGIGKQTVYQFKHALIQDAAYESMLRSQRQQLHQRSAKVLEEQFKETISSQPELVAHHYTEAGLPLRAIPQWLHAGQLASRKHAVTEAIAHLEKGFELLGHLEENEERRALKLDFLLTLGGAYTIIYGYTHSKVGETLNSAKVIAQSIEVSPKLAFILYGLMPYYCLSEKYEILEELIDYTLQFENNDDGGYLFRVFGNMPLGVSSFQRGKFTVAHQVLKKLIDEHDPSVDIPLELTPSGDFKICVEAWWSNCIQFLGLIDQAKSISNRHMSIASNYRKDSRTLYHIYTYAAWRSSESREWALSEKIAAEYVPIVEEFGDPFFINQAKSRYHMAKAFQGDLRSFDAVLELTNDALKLGYNLTIPIYASQIGELYFNFGKYEPALSYIDENLRHLNNTGSHMHTAELYRVKGLTLQALGEPDTIVEKNFTQALELSRKQSAKTFELRASADLARFWQKQGKAKEAYDLLSGVYNWFTEGFDSVDMKEASELLTELSKDKIVKK